MARSFSELRKSRKDELAKLTSALDKMESGGRPKDDRFWAPTVDKAGNGFAVIRWLPPAEGEDMPFIRFWDHGFKGPGGLWYIENSLTSIGREDPVSEMNRKLWAQGEEGKKIVSGDQANDRPGTKRRLHFVANVLVVTDPGNKDNEGKGVLYKFGAKIFNKLKEAMSPEDVEGTPEELRTKAINPFDFDEGADFIIKLRQVEGYRNYDKCEFSKSKPL